MLKEIRNHSNRRGSAKPSKRFNYAHFKKRLGRWREASVKFAETADREYDLIKKMIKENRKQLSKDEVKRIYELISKYFEIFILSKPFKNYFFGPDFLNLTFYLSTSCNDHRNTM